MGLLSPLGLVGFVVYLKTNPVPGQGKLNKSKQAWQPTPVFLPGESRGRGSLVGCRLWGRTESDTTEAT